VQFRGNETLKLKPSLGKGLAMIRAFGRFINLQCLRLVVDKFHRRAIISNLLRSGERMQQPVGKIIPLL
jgi:hypothetical protein